MDKEILVVNNGFTPEKPKEEVIVVGTGPIGAANIKILEAIAELEAEGKKVVYVESMEQLRKGQGAGTINPMQVPTIETKPYILECLPHFNPDAVEPSAKLNYLKRLNLTKEQTNFIMNSPPQRMENESFEQYKKRRMLNNLMIKYRGSF
jgi:hypothetical protein